MRILLAAVLVAAPLAAQHAPPTPFDSVDPMIGTGGEGHTYPGATAPFGMVQLSPDTDTSCVIRACYGHAAGYRYDDPTKHNGLLCRSINPHTLKFRLTVFRSPM